MKCSGLFAALRHIQIEAGTVRLSWTPCRRAGTQLGAPIILITPRWPSAGYLAEIWWPFGCSGLHWPSGNLSITAIGRGCHVYLHLPPRPVLEYQSGSTCATAGFFFAARIHYLDFLSIHMVMRTANVI